VGDVEAEEVGSEVVGPEEEVGADVEDPPAVAVAVAATAESADWNELIDGEDGNDPILDPAMGDPGDPGCAARGALK
jgi:hypothetical protein